MRFLLLSQTRAFHIDLWSVHTAVSISVLPIQPLFLADSYKCCWWHIKGVLTRKMKEFLRGSRARCVCEREIWKGWPLQPGFLFLYVVVALIFFFFWKGFIFKNNHRLFPPKKSFKFVSTWNVATCHWTMSFGSVLMAALANSLRIPGSSGLRLVQLPIWYATPFNPGMMVSYLSFFLYFFSYSGKRILSTIWRARRDAAGTVVSAGVVYAHKSGEKV